MSEQFKAEDIELLPHGIAPPRMGVRPVTMSVECNCGEQYTNWMEFYRHQSDAYRELWLEVKKASG